MQADLMRRFNETELMSDFNAFAYAASPWIWETAYRSIRPRTPNREMIADDVTNLVLARVHSMPSELRWSPRIGPLENWLGTMIRNCVRDEFRGQARRVRRKKEHASEVVVAGVDPDMARYRSDRQSAEEREFYEHYWPRVEAAMKTLPACQQILLNLRFFEAMSYPKIGEELKLDNQKVRRDTLKALALLRGRLREDGGCAA